MIVRSLSTLFLFLSEPLLLLARSGGRGDGVGADGAGAPSSSRTGSFPHRGAIAATRARSRVVYCYGAGLAAVQPLENP